MTVDKSSLSETDICTQFITPALQQAGWDFPTQVRQEVNFTAGQILVQGKTVKRGDKKRADYVLSYRENLRIGVVEAKDNTQAVGAGMQQALSYAAPDALDLPFVFSSNGDGFLFHDKTATSGPTERELALHEFPSPTELWDKFCIWKNLPTGGRALAEQEYYSDGSGKEPRYYQLNAINRVIEAIARGENRVLLVMATGTGKTYTAFQIIWRLWKSGQKKRILFLADRNILVDQTKTNDFKPFGGAMTKVTGKKIDHSFEIYLALYQAITGPEETQKAYKKFSPEFFDLIVIDECHRGSAAEDSEWREILDYFGSATQIGLTATPKETKTVSNIEYFGDPVYTYSLKQGIQDGFLAPYRVVRIDLDKDLTGWRPEEGKVDKHGVEIPDQVYNAKDFDKTLVLEQRTQRVAERVTEFLKGTNRLDKTIVFCEDIDHAERMRQALVNLNADLVQQNHKYVMRITGDSVEGKLELDNFIDPEKTHPVIATTSKLLTTGVDAQTCKLIVLDRTIQSMTEFKQIIGRGTRVNEDYGKLFFTIMDFRKATELFADPDFDGPPICIYEPQPGEDVVPPEDEPEGGETGEESGDEGEAPDDWDGEEGDGEGEAGPGGGGKRQKYYVHDVAVRIVAERVQYFDPQSGKLITESLKDFTKKRVDQQFASLDQFIQTWTAAERKQAILDELQREGVLLAALADEVGQDFDPFDLICHVAFDQPPLTRKERADNVRKRDYFTKYGEQARQVLDALLQKYADEGLEPLEDMAVLKVDPLSRFGTPLEIIKFFGSREAYQAAVQELEGWLYRVAK